MKRNAFTMTEMLVALAVGMFILNIAFSSFFFTQKFIRKTEMLGAKNDCAQALILWTLSGRTQAGVPFPSTPQFRGVTGKIVDTNGVSSDYHDLVVFTEFACVSVVAGATNRTIKVRGNHGLVVGQQVELIKTGNVVESAVPSTVTSLSGSDGFVCANTLTDVIKVRPILARLCVPKAGP